MSILHPPDPHNPAIFLCAQSGCRECVQALLKRHEGLVRFIVRGQIGGGVPDEDLLQEGRIALWWAIQTYDPGRGAAFSTFAAVVIKHQVWRVTARERRCRRLVRQAEPADAYLELESGLWWEQVDQILLEACRYLTKRQRQVLNLLYGGEGEQSRVNLAAAGRSLGISRERVRQLHNDALVVLRLPAFSVRLRQLCQQDSREAYLHSRQLSRRWLHKKGAA